MPNWCSTRMVVYGEKDAVVKMHDFMQKAFDDAPMKEDVDNPHTWLGQLPVAARIDHHKVECRGWLNELSDVETDKRGTFFFVDSDDAWAPKLPTFFDQLAEKVLGDRQEDILFEYVAEEGGNGIYTNTDTEGVFFPERFIVDIYDVDVMYFENGEVALQYLNETLSAEFKSVEDAENSDDERFSFHHFDTTD